MPSLTIFQKYHKRCYSKSALVPCLSNRGREVKNLNLTTKLLFYVRRALKSIHVAWTFADFDTLQKK